MHYSLVFYELCYAVSALKSETASSASQYASTATLQSNETSDFQKFDKLTIIIRGEFIPVTAIKAYAGVQEQVQYFLALAVDGVTGHLHALVSLPPRKRPPVSTE
jgi:hypothetical protein